MKIMKNVRVHDAATPMFRTRGRYFTRDEVLEPLAPGKQMLSWMIWDGDLKPIIDSAVEAIGPLVAKGLTPGNTLAAEQGPVQAGLLGKAWADSVLHAIGSAVRHAAAEIGSDDSDGGPDQVNIGELYQCARNLQQAFEAGDLSTTEMAFDALKRTADGIRRGSAAKPRTGDNGGDPTAGQREAHRVRTAHDQFQAGLARLPWGRKPTQVSTGDAASDGKVRDLMHQSHRATHMGEKVGAMNEAAREFWKARTADTSAPSVGTTDPANRSVADINAANAAFWAARR